MLALRLLSWMKMSNSFSAKHETEAARIDIHDSWTVPLNRVFGIWQNYNERRLE